MHCTAAPRLHVCARQTHQSRLASRVKKLHGRPQDARTHARIRVVRELLMRPTGAPVSRGGEVGRSTPCPCRARRARPVRSRNLEPAKRMRATPIAAAPTDRRRGLRTSSFPPHHRPIDCGNGCRAERAVGAAGILAWQRTAAGSRRISSRPADRELLPRGATVRQAD